MNEMSAGSNIKEDRYGLPMKLGDGLLLRWATEADAEALASFNVRQHSDDPEEPEEFIRYWTMDLFHGVHPTVQPSDFTVVTDENRGGEIVSTVGLISQQWTYDGLPFGCGRPELIATDTAYRRRGLIRKQMDLIHAKSADRREMVQAITGIPWFYRKFGYEMALNLGGGRVFLWSRRGNDEPVDQEQYHLRPATVDDIPILVTLYAIHCDESLITMVRTGPVWLYQLEGAHRESDSASHIFLIEEDDERIVGYVEYRLWGARWIVREFAVQPGCSWRKVALFVTRALKRLADERNKERNEQIDRIYFALGVQHRVYEALGTQLEAQTSPYAWYIRVPDLPAFFHYISPVLEKRLARSVLAGHSGEIKLNFYVSNLTLTFEQGRITQIGRFEPKRVEEGDAMFPGLTFLQLLFGYRSIQELTDARADCFTRKAESAILLNILFPKQWSNVIGLQ